MNNLDGLFGSDIDEKKRVGILKELAKLSSTFDKIKFVYDHVGHDFLLTNGAQAISDEFYELLNGDSSAYESINAYIVNLYVKRQKAEFFDVRKVEFSKRVEKCLSVREVKLLIQDEIEEIQARTKQSKESEEPADRAWFEGYYCERRKLPIPIFPATYENCFHATNGSVECLFELELQKQLDEIAEAEKIPEDKAKYALGSQYEIVLFFIYSGQLNALSTQLGNSNSKISKAIGAITGVKSESIRQLLIYLPYGYKDPRNRKLYQEAYILKTLDTLQAIGLDTSNLQKIYDDLP